MKLSEMFSQFVVEFVEVEECGRPMRSRDLNILVPYDHTFRHPQHREYGVSFCEEHKKVALCIKFFANNFIRDTVEYGSEIPAHEA